VSGIDAIAELCVVRADADGRDDPLGGPREQGDQQPGQVLDGPPVGEAGTDGHDDLERTRRVHAVLVQARNREKMPPLTAASGVGTHFVLLRSRIEGMILMTDSGRTRRHPASART
jgi:hypothetical protein